VTLRRKIGYKVVFHKRSVPEAGDIAKKEFYSNENEEPAHMHVTKGDGNAKIWLRPSIEEEYSYNFTVRERRDIRELIRVNYETLTEA
jgi:Domain of unknown function (DUF4160)